MKICVDTTILIDILKDEFRDHQDRLYNAMAEGETLLSPTVVFAELMPQFGGEGHLLDLFLSEHKITIEPLDRESTFHAGVRWMAYLKKKTKKKCPHCSQPLAFKAHFLSDFYIGGFAVARCDKLLTRDRGIYRTYFKDLALY